MFIQLLLLSIFSSSVKGSINPYGCHQCGNVNRKAVPCERGPNGTIANPELTDCEASDAQPCADLLIVILREKFFIKDPNTDSLNRKTEKDVFCFELEYKNYYASCCASQTFMRCAQHVKRHQLSPEDKEKGSKFSRRCPGINLTGDDEDVKDPKYSGQDYEPSLDEDRPIALWISLIVLCFIALVILCSAPFLLGYCFGQLGDRVYHD